METQFTSISFMSCPKVRLPFLKKREINGKPFTFLTVINQTVLTRSNKLFVCIWISDYFSL